MSAFKKGDIVRHTILETEKIVIGVGRDRYLCVHPNDVSTDGQIRSHARVAMHRSINLEKIGFRDGIKEMNLENLYQQEIVTRRLFRGKWFRREVLINLLFILAATFVVIALFEGIDYVREKLETHAVGRRQQLETEYKRKIRRELQEKRREAQFKLLQTGR